MKIDKILEKSRTISFVVGPSLLALIGIVFMFLSDLGLENSSTWLIGSVLLTFGSAIVGYISEIRKENHLLVYILKGIAFGLAVGFIIYLICFSNSDICTTLTVNSKFRMYINNKKIEIPRIQIRDILLAVSYVVTALGVLSQGINIGLNAYLGIKD